MRLIDADALMNEFDRTLLGNNPRGVIRATIEDAPSVEPERKRGKWILTEDEDYEYCTCSECGYQNGENWMIGSDIPFCAMCGADMRDPLTGHMNPPEE